MNSSKNIYRCTVALLITMIMMAANQDSLIKIGDKAPEFTLYTVNNESISLNDFKGKIVVIHLWSHTCPHCRLQNKKLPGIVVPYKKSNLAYVMIDIDIDTIGWRGVIKEDKLNFAIHAKDQHDGGAKTMIDYNATGTPCINIADQKGTLIDVNITDTQLKNRLKKCFPGVL